MGVRETFGIHSDNVLTPNVYLKWPWPIQKIRKIPVNKVQEIFIGPKLKDEHGKIKKPDVVLWTQSHYAKEGRFLIATDADKDTKSTNKKQKKVDTNSEDVPVSMIAAFLPVQFKIKPDKVLDYAYLHKNPTETLQGISEKEITEYFASADMLALMSSKRKQAIDTIQNRIQIAADKINLGVKIIAVAFLDAHPPIDDNKLPEAFQAVIGAQEEKEAEIWKAKAYKAKTIPRAEAEALQLVLQAESYKDEQTKVSKAEIKRFRQRMIGYRAMPEMYILNAKMDFLENDCQSVRKYIVPNTSQYDVYVINLEEKQRLDLLDITDLQEDNK
jgi:regulator of protease activity HflC (stomatin/prohibitin superfamily)